MADIRFLLQLDGVDEAEIREYFETRTIRSLDLDAYLRFLNRIPIPTHSEQRERRGPRADRPFVLG